RPSDVSAVVGRDEVLGRDAGSVRDIHRAAQRARRFNSEQAQIDALDVMRHPGDRVEAAAMIRFPQWTPDRLAHVDPLVVAALDDDVLARRREWTRTIGREIPGRVAR